MVKKQQMRWNRHTVQSFLDVRIHVLNGSLENAFRQWRFSANRSTASGRGRSVITPQLCMLSSDLCASEEISKQ
jgi:hypothetical protein